MTTILHGDDDVKIHAELSHHLDLAKQKNIPVVRLTAKGLAFSDLETALGTDELFATEKTVVIDGLHSLPKSKLKEELIDLIRSMQTDIEVILLENKILTPTQLKKFPQARVSLSKIPAQLFAWLDSLGLQPATKLITVFHDIIKNQEPELVFAMIIRQTRILLSYVSDGVYSGPPFGKTKIMRQARSFSITKLILLHEKLLDIDLGQKTSRSVLTLTQEIDLWLTEL